MQKIILFALALASFVSASIVHAGAFASAVVNYNPGSGFTPDYTNADTIIGQPSAQDSYGDAVDPFDSAWDTNQLLSMGAGGSVTVRFDAPILKLPNKNRDFIIFGNSFFNVPNFDDPFDQWMTDGDVFSNPAQTQVSVSQDGVTFYRLNPALAPEVSYLYPTDASGDFQKPVDPGLVPTNFAGLTLAQIRGLYNGSAGGASYDISWAQDTNDNSVFLPEIRYIRVDVLSGEANVCGFASVAGTVLAETFATNPVVDAWQTFGNASLLQWNPTNQNLDVTWDSSQPNSYFYHPLGTIVGKSDDFSFGFDLLLNDYSVSGFSFELAAGLQNFSKTTSPGFHRGGTNSQPNLVEFDFFPAFSHYTATVCPTLTSTNNLWATEFEDFALPTGIVMRVNMNYTASNQTATLTITTNGISAGQIYPLALPPSFTDFRVDTFAVESYNDGGQNPQYAGSILAHGSIGNILITAPLPPVNYLQANMAGGISQVAFYSLTNWNYVLEGSSNLLTWQAVAPAALGTGGMLMLQDTNVLSAQQFYRVSAAR